MQGVGITDWDLGAAEAKLLDWLAPSFHGEMDYMAKHGTKRNRPAESVPGTVGIISARMDYLPPDGHRIYGCDDGQLICHWCRFVQTCRSPVCHRARA